MGITCWGLLQSQAGLFGFGLEESFAGLFQKGSRMAASNPFKPAPSKQLVGLLALTLAVPAQRAAADCSVTNTGVAPLNEMGFNTYSNSAGGLYPDGANTRPPAHESAGMQIAT